MNEVRDLIYETNGVRADLNEGSLRVQHEYILFFLAFCVVIASCIAVFKSGFVLD